MIDISWKYDLCQVLGIWGYGVWGMGCGVSGGGRLAMEGSYITLPKS